jgi:NTE family protein
MKNGLRIGLALSGGGYRAAAFHLGTMRSLREMGLLDKVDVISTVSGGSIVGASYALSAKEKMDYPDFEKKFIEKLGKSVIKRVLTSLTFFRIAAYILGWLVLIVCLQFTLVPWVSLIVLVVGIYFIVSNQFDIFPVSSLIEGIYDRIFFGGFKLKHLPESPILAVNSTNLETSRPFTFSRSRMSDSTYDYPPTIPPIKFKAAEYPVARAVMASSCVPFAFTPVPVHTKYFVNPADAKRIRPMLVDGGIFDNQGIHKVTFAKSEYHCDVVIVSDAGNKMSFQSSYNNVITLLARVSDLFMNRIKNFQMSQQLYPPAGMPKKEVAYVSLGWDLESSLKEFVDSVSRGNILASVLASHQIPPDCLSPQIDKEKIKLFLQERFGIAKLGLRAQSAPARELARSVSTNLTTLSREKIFALINHAELMTELHVKLYCPSIAN